MKLVLVKEVIQVLLHKVATSHINKTPTNTAVI